jgi:hypothetical protein
LKVNTSKALLGIGVIAMMSAVVHVGATELDYASVAILSCKDFIEGYETDLLDSLVPSIRTYLLRGDRDQQSLSATNIGAYVAMVCRLHENWRVGAAVEDLTGQKKHGRLPALPKGDATDNPDVEAQWEAFDKWLHHQGPRPQFK